MKLLPLFLILLLAGDTQAHGQPAQPATPSTQPAAPLLPAAKLTTSDTSAPLPPTDPVVTALANVRLAAAGVQTAQAKVESLKTAQADLATAQAALTQARVDLATLLDPLGPVPAPPGPTPPAPAHRFAMLAVTSTATCAPCRQLAPILDKLTASGVVVETADGNDASVLARWGVTAIPTLVLTVDGKVAGKLGTHSRCVGVWSQAEYQTWWNGFLDWASKEYPPAPPKGQLP